MNAAPGAPEPPPPPEQSVALVRYRVLVPHLHDGVTLRAAAATAGVPYRTVQRWLAAYRQGGLKALDMAPRRDRGRRRIPEELVALIEGLALRTPRLPIAAVHRQAVSVAARNGWPPPGYATVHRIVAAVDPGLMVMAHEGTKRYREVFELVYRREAKAPNEIWQADHTQLDLWVLDGKGRPARPWLTVIEDDHSRAVVGYTVSLEAPSAMSTALAFRHAIWRKPEADWHVCGIPSVFHLEHGCPLTTVSPAATRLPDLGDSSFLS